MQITEEIVFLYKKLQRIYKLQEKQAESEEINFIEVEEIASHFASLYEKLRNSVDFKEVHLLRRFAIERNLKRRFVLEMLKPEIAQSLVEELVRARYLPNKSIPETQIPEVADIIAKYNQLFLLMNDVYHGDEAKKYLDWLIGIEACEIDMLLNPENIADAVIETMYQMTKSRVKLQGDNMNIREKNIQLYIAIHKSLVKSDDTIISYHLLNLYFDQWPEADDDLIKLLATHLSAVYKNIQGHLNHPYQRKILKAIKEPVVTFQVLHELILAHGQGFEELLIDPEKLQAEAKILVNQKYKKLRSKISRASLRAIVYIFITKVLLALVLEFPYEMYVIKNLNHINLAINVVFPPLLMFLVTLSVVPPSKENTERILNNLQELIYGEGEQSILCQLRVKYSQHFGFQIFYYSMYFLLYLVVFGGIIYLLNYLHFNLLSGAIFLFFLTAVSFFAIRIRNSAQELMVVKRQEDPISFFVNFFSLPVIAVGRWLSTKFKKLNLFAFIMDFVIEAPFKMFVAAFEDWLGFMREKQEEVYHDKQ